MLYGEEPGVLRVKILKGELDDPNAVVVQLEEIVRDGSFRELYVDLGDYDTLTSLQIGAMVAIHMTAYENLCRTVFEHLTVRSLEVLKLAGVDKLIAVHHGKGIRDKSFGN